MFKIIGADGKQYGPVTKEQLRLWIIDGRANAQTRVLAEGETEWKSLKDFPEFAAPPPMTAVKPAPNHFSGSSITDGKAIGSMVCGILAMTLCSLFTGIPAVILGHISRSNIRKSMGQLKGEGMALAGLIMGYVSLAILSIFLILITATISIPSLLRSRQAANESAAVASLRAITTAEISYLSSSGEGNYGNLSQLVRAGLMDSRFAMNGGSVSGYLFSITVDGEEYTAEATPVSPSTGRYGYYSRPDGVVYWSAAASLAPPALAGMPVD